MIIAGIIIAYLAAGITVNVAANHWLHLKSDYRQLGTPLAIVIQSTVITMWPLAVAALIVALLRDHVPQPQIAHVPQPIIVREHRAIDARALANQLIARSYRDSRLLTHLQVQKLVYFCHAWCLAIHGQPMIRQDISMGDYGPLVQELLQPLGIYGGRQTCPIPGVETPCMSSAQDKLIDELLLKYGKLSGLQLSSVAHQAGTPWQVMHEAGHVRGKTIPDQLITEHYTRQYQEYRHEHQANTPKGDALACA